VFLLDDKIKGSQFCIVPRSEHIVSHGREVLPTVESTVKDCVLSCGSEMHLALGCDPSNQVKILVWHQKKFLPSLISNYYQPFSHVCCIADPFTILQSLPYLEEQKGT